MEILDTVICNVVSYSLRVAKNWFSKLHHPLPFLLSFANVVLSGFLVFCALAPIYSMEFATLELIAKIALFIAAVFIAVVINLIVKKVEKFKFDPLTGLRILTSEALENLPKEKERFHKGISVALFDVDNFKSVNDKFGRSLADQLLQEMAISLRKSCRMRPNNPLRMPMPMSNSYSEIRQRPDELYRYYNRRGDEFLLILFNASLCDAVTKAIPRILKHYYEEDFSSTLQVDSTPISKLVFSCGVVHVSGSDTEESLKRRLDEALREAKQKKNRICGRDDTGRIWATEEVYEGNPLTRRQ